MSGSTTGGGQLNEAGLEIDVCAPQGDADGWYFVQGRHPCQPGSIDACSGLDPIVQILEASFSPGGTPLEFCGGGDYAVDILCPFCDPADPQAVIDTVELDLPSAIEDCFTLTDWQAGFGGASRFICATAESPRIRITAEMGTIIASADVFETWLQFLYIDWDPTGTFPPAYYDCNGIWRFLIEDARVFIEAEPRFDRTTSCKDEISSVTIGGRWSSLHLLAAPEEPCGWVFEGIQGLPDRPEFEWLRNLVRDQVSAAMGNALGADADDQLRASSVAIMERARDSIRLVSAHAAPIGIDYAFDLRDGQEQALSVGAVYLTSHDEDDDGVGDRWDSCREHPNDACRVFVDRNRDGVPDRAFEFASDIPDDFADCDDLRPCAAGWSCDGGGACLPASDELGYWADCDDDARLDTAFAGRSDQVVDCDGDGVADACDNCPRSPNPGQADGDGDGRGWECDNCPFDANPEQEDEDRDGAGDACDPCRSDPAIPSRWTPRQDADEDGVPSYCDNCPTAANFDQTDGDGDGVGDACDNCATVRNATQTNCDRAIEPDSLPLVARPGDACDDTLCVEPHGVRFVPRSLGPLRWTDDNVPYLDFMSAHAARTSFTGTGRHDGCGVAGTGPCPYGDEGADFAYQKVEQGWCECWRWDPAATFEDNLLGCEDDCPTWIDWSAILDAPDDRTPLGRHGFWPTEWQQADGALCPRDGGVWASNAPGPRSDNPASAGDDFSPCSAIYCDPGAAKGELDERGVACPAAPVCDPAAGPCAPDEAFAFCDDYRGDAATGPFAAGGVLASPTWLYRCERRPSGNDAGKAPDGTLPWLSPAGSCASRVRLRYLPAHRHFLSGDLHRVKEDSLPTYTWPALTCNFFGTGRPDLDGTPTPDVGAGSSLPLVPGANDLLPGALQELRDLHHVWRVPRGPPSAGTDDCPVCDEAVYSLAHGMAIERVPAAFETPADVPATEGFGAAEATLPDGRHRAFLFSGLAAGSAVPAADLFAGELDGAGMRRWRKLGGEPAASRADAVATVAGGVASFAPVRTRLDGEVVAVLGRGGTIDVYALALPSLQAVAGRAARAGAAAPLRSFQVRRAAALAATPSGHVVVATTGLTHYLLDVESGALVPIAAADRLTEITRAVAAPDGSAVYLLGENSEGAALVRLDLGRLEQAGFAQLPPPPPLCVLDRSCLPRPGGDTGAGGIPWVDPRPPPPELLVRPAPRASPLDLTVGGDGTVFAAYEGVPHLYKFRRDTQGIQLDGELSELLGYYALGPATRIAASPTRPGYLYLGTADGRLIGLDTLQRRIDLEARLDAPVGSVSLAPDGILAAVALDTGAVASVDLLSGTVRPAGALQATELAAGSDGTSALVVAGSSVLHLKGLSVDERTPLPRVGGTLLPTLRGGPLLFVGGSAAGSFLLHPSTGRWDPLAGQGEPPPRVGAAAVLDPAHRVAYVLGGALVATGQLTGEVWALDLATRAWWLAGDDPDFAVRDAAALWDARTGRILLFGGRTPAGTTARLAAFEPLRERFWDLAPSCGRSGCPPAVAGAALVRDLVTDMVVAVGGDAGGAPAGIWGLEQRLLWSDPQWVRVHPEVVAR